MTAKEKAIIIYEKFYPLANPGGYYTDVEYVPGNDTNIHKNAKKCALICVDEILDVLDWISENTDENYWREVKQELEKM